ncbi:DUF6011 domain-containing protein [Metasolibacillus sp.]|uniref:DUF6011 domain-containing protein n=1 Tax=Metasolibacillus sp. TaxID=2703680 RepID=UPI0025DD8F7A|nr:DUF6011 domain-containing protein [Metasolibacillus sp.]MCT6926365.1 DUF6011 domain-containing protein [Metasolibacillus sp.]
MKLCERCSRPLKSQKSMENGMGPVCKKKHEKELADAEFERNQMNLDEVIEEATA